MRTTLATLFAGIAVASATGQTTLRAYLNAHPWSPAAKGPLLVLEPDRGLPGGSSGPLGAVGRKVATIGQMHAIVPTTMIVIDDSLNQPPNLYEGLTADQKVLYLLKSLNDSQWNLITGPGIGLDDLQGEQKLVYESLLPQPFGWSSFTVAPNGFFGPEGPKGTLSEDERRGVRLKIERAIQMGVFLKNPPGSTSEFGTERYHGKPGTVTYERDQSRDFVQKSAFGVEIRKEMENRTKPSQLDTRTAAFSRPVRVEPETTVGAILRAAGAAVGAEIIPDFRVADRKVAFLGGQAKARDLLAALALSVEGTYRKVGTAYVLTSDLEGMGSRKLLLAFWQRRVEREAERRREEWQRQIGVSGRVSKVGYDPHAPLAPSEALGQTIENNDLKMDWTGIPSSQLTPGLRTFLDTWDLEYRTQPIQKDKVRLSSNLVYRFILPDGKPLTPEGSLGGMHEFMGVPSGPFKEPVVPAGPFTMPATTELGFLIEAADAEAATDAVRLVSGFHGSRLWLLTRSAEALKAALVEGKAKGVAVGLAIRPWRWPTNEPDMNIAGEFGSAIAEKIADLHATDGYRQFDVNGRLGPWISPADPAVTTAWDGYAGLAATPGLDGVMCLETQPFGYEGKRERWQSMVGPLDWALVSHGYTTAQRIAFLRAQGVDPVDIGDHQYFTTPDLRQTYFFDDGLRGMPSMYDGTDDTNPKTRKVGDLWRQMLADANREAMLRLIQRIHPTYIEPRLPNINSVSDLPGAVVPFNPANPLPQWDPRGAGDHAAGAYAFVPLWPDPTASAARTPTFILSAIATQPGMAKRFRPLMDLTNIPRDQLGSVLQLWLKPAGDVP